MSFRRGADVAVVVIGAALLTAAMAATVLRAPTTRVFGMAIVGDRHDPFTVMEQFAQPIHGGMFAQPATDIPGALLARVIGPVAAYNVLVLISFPLSAAGGYLLARHLLISRAGAALAAMAFAFSPFHLAQAAYHPHIAQTEWIALYLLALWRCLDYASAWAVALLCAATLIVCLSNFYGGFIAAVMTPCAIGAYWLWIGRRSDHGTRSLVVTLGALGVLGACGLGYAAHAASGALSLSGLPAFPRADLLRYSAVWWAYLMPPVANPWLGATAHHLLTAANVRQGLLEQQVSLGAGVIILALLAVCWIFSRERAAGEGAAAPVLLSVAAIAFVCSLSPDWHVGATVWPRPSALLYTVLPMFRAYARFGVVVQLMAALLAGIAVDRLRRTGATSARIVCVALTAMIVLEYAVAPSAMSRDVLPTAAHRWVAQQSHPLRVLDCTPLDQDSSSLRWLTNGRVELMGGPIDDCSAPHLADLLAASGYTHVLVRRGTEDGEWILNRPPAEGLSLMAHFGDGDVFTVDAARPPIYTMLMTGFFARDRDATWPWRRWMSADATWTAVVTADRPLLATLDLELLALDHRRHMTVQLDGRQVQTLLVEPSRRHYQIGPFIATPGQHTVAFHAVDPVTIADDEIHNGDRRSLSCAFGDWRWTTRAVLR